MKNPSISVVVPVYKVEAWLPACVDSLLKQDFDDFELILVDDGSPDGCGAICDEYARKDERVRVIHRQNGGLSAARNSGIEAARGQYIAFVDSDDWVAPDYLSRMYKTAQTQQADLVVCGVEDTPDSGQRLAEPALTGPQQEGLFTGRELIGCFLGPCSTYYTVAWNKLYRASLWQELRYPEGMIHEDDAVAPCLYAACGRVVCLAQPLYFYRLRQGSICRTGVSAGSFDGVSAHAAWCRFFAAEPELAPHLGKALEGCWQRYLSVCAEAFRTQDLSWQLCARWSEVQAEMKALLPLLRQCYTLSARQKLSCRRWALKKLPLPAKTGKKRVALLLPPELPVPPVHGGAVETLAQHLVTENQREGKLELCVISRFDPEALARAGQYKNTLFYYQQPPRRSLGYSLRYRLSGNRLHWNRWYADCLGFLKRLDADVCIAEGGDLTGWAQASRTLGREKFLAHLHGETPGSPELDRIYSGALAISGYIAKLWQSGTQRPVKLVPNCVNAEQFSQGDAARQAAARALRRELGYTDEDFVVLFCGRTCPEKGIHQLVAAMQKLEDPKVKLLVVGSPFFGAESNSPYFDKLKKDAALLSDRIQFTGFVENSRLPAYYRLADAACFPALWEESAGITAIEAMACGCPVIATRSGGMPEYLEGSKAILLERSEVWKPEGLVPVEGAAPLADTLAQAIRRLSQNEELCRQMRDAGLETAKRYTTREYYQNILHALD